jgi:hypothetical protein
MKTPFYDNNVDLWKIIMRLEFNRSITNITLADDCAELQVDTEFADKVESVGISSVNRNDIERQICLNKFCTRRATKQNQVRFSVIKSDLPAQNT